MSTKYTLPPHVHLNPREMQDAVLEFRKWKESVEDRLAALELVEKQRWIRLADKQPSTEQIDPPPDSAV